MNYFKMNRILRFKRIKSKLLLSQRFKTKNLIFDKKGVNGIIKVIDFGTSRKFDNKRKMTKRLGTPYYIAPEVL